MFYVKDTRKDIGDDYSCRLCCEVFQGVKKSSEASETNKICDRDTLLFISQNIERYLRNHEQSLEAANIALSLGAIDGFTKENRTQYIFFARQDRTKNEQKLTSLINYIQNDHNRNKDFSPIIIALPLSFIAPEKISLADADPPLINTTTGFLVTTPRVAL